MISSRLLAVASMVDKNKTVFDVGSDHAKLPCFLVLNDIVPKAYAGDNKPGPLASAELTISHYHLNGKVIAVLSDGLENASDDVNEVIISGMGYFTIEHILDSCDVSSYENFIVQSNTDVDKLRKYLSDRHFTITDEKVVQDGFYYQIIKFNSCYHEAYTDLEIRYGPMLLKRRDVEFIDFLHHQLKYFKDLYERSGREDYGETIREIENIL